MRIGDRRTTGIGATAGKRTPGNATSAGWGRQLAGSAGVAKRRRLGLWGPRAADPAPRKGNDAGTIAAPEVRALRPLRPAREAVARGRGRGAVAGGAAQASEQGRLVLRGLSARRGHRASRRDVRIRPARLTTTNRADRVFALFDLWTLGGLIVSGIPTFVALWQCRPDPEADFPSGPYGIR